MKKQQIGEKMTNNNIESIRVVRNERNELNFFRHELLNLRRNSQIDEQWIGDKIEEDPSLIVGLGEEVDVIKRERRQPYGRLDFLMQDEDEKIRYALELQLGSADPSHIVRVVNYWNHERKRHPDYEHFPVLVAEDIPEKYLEFISTIDVPMIVYKLLPIRTQDKVSLVFSKILDMRAPLDERENDSTEETNRSYWEKKGTNETIDILDNLYKVVQKIDPVFELKYNKFHIGLRKRNGSVHNFVAFKPKKKFLKLEVRKVEKDEKLNRLLDEKDLDWSYSDRYRCYNFKIKPKHMKNHHDTIKYFIEHCINLYLLY